MNIRLTANPDKASRITQNLPLPLDLIQGDRLFRAMPRVGDLDEEARTFRAVVATSTPVQRRDTKGMFWEVLDPAGLIFNEGDDFYLDILRQISLENGDIPGVPRPSCLSPSTRR